VDRRLVEPRLVLRRHAHRVGAPERDVAGRVLVEEGVEEDRVQRPDAPRAVDERHLAQPRGALVAAGVGAQDLGVLLGVDPHRAPARELDLEPPDDRAADHERLGRADDPVDALRIGRREDLLRWEVGHVHDAVDGLEASCDPARGRQQADAQVGAGSLEMQRVEPFGRHALRHVHEHVGALSPDGDRVRLVEAAHVQDLLA
jgi:hypothetical protein